MNEDVASILRKKQTILGPARHEGPVPGELASEILAADAPDLALEMPPIDHVIERRSALEPLSIGSLGDAVPFGPRGAFKRTAKVGMGALDE